MKKTVTILFLMVLLLGCGSTRQLDALYTFDDLTISYPSDLNLDGKITATYNASLKNDDLYITIEKIINDNNYSFDEIKSKFKETMSLAFEKVEKIKESNTQAIYKLNDYNIAGLYYKDDKTYYVVLTQESDGLKDNYDWLLKSFKEVKVKG